MLDNPADITQSVPPPGGSPRLDARELAAERTSMPVFLAALRQRRWTLAATVILVPLCAFLILRQVTPLYTATGSLIYEPSEYTLRELQSILRADPTTDAMMASQAELLHSLKVAQEVAKRGNLYRNPEFNAALRPPGLAHRLLEQLRGLLGMETDAPPEPATVAADDTDGDAPDAAPTPKAGQHLYGPRIDPTLEQTMLAVQDALHASPVRQSHVIEVTFTAADPAVAATAVNNAMDIYIKGQYAAKHRLVEHANELLDKQAHELRQQVQRIEEKMSAYREAHSLNHGMHASTDSEAITHLTEDLVKARADRADADSRLNAAKGGAGSAALAAVAPSVVTLRARQDELAAEIQSQRGRLGSAHPEAQSLSREYAEGERALSAELGRIVAATQAEQRAATERVATLEQNLRDAEKDADVAARAQIPLDAMARDLDAARSQLQAVLDRMQQTAQQAAVESSEAHEISQALTPGRPSSPRVAQTMVAALAGGAFLGLLLVYLLHLADNSFHSGDEVRSITGLPCFALVPQIGKRALGSVPIHDYVARRPLTAFAEQIRALRAGLWFGTDRYRVVAITAARPAEGKSILTLSLGRSARLSGDRVLVIECDLRQPSFARRFGGNPSLGLAELLKGKIGWQEAVQTDPLTGMDFIASGKPGGDVLALFLSDAMGALLAAVRQEYDLVLLDAPPTQAMTEARAVAAAADATLLCVRWRSTPRNALLNTLDILHDARARVLGTVLTRVDPRAHLRSGYADAEVYHRRYKSYYRG